MTEPRLQIIIIENVCYQDGAHYSYSLLKEVLRLLVDKGNKIEFFKGI